MEKPTSIYCIAHGTLLNVMWQPGWEGSLGENTYMAESLCSLPGTITTLLISSTPIQNTKFKRKKIKIKSDLRCNL